jgi:hypothetical protein
MGARFHAILAADTFRCAALLSAFSVTGAADAADTPTRNALPATIVGTEVGDTIEGTAGDDVIVGLGGADYITAGGGNDTICAGDNVAAGPFETADLYTWDQAYGGAGDDWIDGGPGLDILVGHDGNDYVTAGPTTSLVAPATSETANSSTEEPAATRCSAATSPTTWTAGRPWTR